MRRTEVANDNLTREEIEDLQRELAERDLDDRRDREAELYKEAHEHPFV